MKKIITSIFILSGLTIFFCGDYSIADEVVLCVSDTDQYIVTVNEKGDCMEHERQMVIRGSQMAEKKSVTPVANFNENEKCDGEGSITEIGFDENGNGKLDTDEIMTTGSNCSMPIAEESES